MRAITVLCLFLILTACTGQGQVTGEPGAPTEMPARLPVQPTATSEPATETPAKPAAQPAAIPSFESSVLLAQWNANERRREILPVDPATGQAVPGQAPLIIGKISQFAGVQTLSSDGRWLAAIESHGQVSEPNGGGTSHYPSADVLHLVDVTAWRAVTTTLPGRGWVWPITFSPDTARLALGYHNRTSSTLMLFDTGTGQLIAQQALAFRPSLMKYTQEGTALAIYGQPLSAVPGIAKPDPPRVLLVDAATLDILWDQPLASVISGSWCLENCDAPHGEQMFAGWWPAVVPSHDGHTLYIVHADEEKLTAVDFDARTVHSVEIREARSWFEELLALTAGVAEAKGGENGAFKEAVLSPDGTRLYVVGRTVNSTRDARGEWQVTEAFLGLQVIDVESGRKVTGLDGQAKAIGTTPDGAYLLLDDWDGRVWWTEVLDAESLQRVARLERWAVVPARRIDGQPILLASDPYRGSQFAVLDPRSFDIVDTWSVSEHAEWVTTSP